MTLSIRWCTYIC